MTFGECLKDMLLTFNISMSRLAKSIHVDSSLVNRWVHGDRIPPFNSSYIENIAEYLSKNVRNEFQVNNINNILLEQGLKFDNLNNINDKIKTALLKAQGYSIQFKNGYLKDKNTKIAEKTSRERKDKLIPKAALETYTMEHLLQKKGLQEIVELSCNDKVVFGSDNIDKLAIDLLNVAASTDFAENKIIYMTFNSNFSKPKDEFVKLRTYFLKVIRAGWKIIILMRIDNDVNRILNFNKFAISLVIQGGLTIYYCTKYCSFNAERETFVIPEVGAISIFANSSSPKMNTAFFLKSCSAVNVFEEYFKFMLKNNSHRLIRYYARNECMKYCSFLAECEESIGNRMTFNSCLSTLMLPEHIYYRLLKKSDISDSMKQFAFINFKKQRNSFRKNVRHYEFKEIYIVDSIYNLIKHQEFFLYYYSGVKKIKLKVQDIIELLENVIHNLKTYANYNISFINKKSEAFAGLSNFSFVLKERKALFYENFDLEENYPSVRISICEPFSVNAYSDFFEKDWDRIAPLFKEKIEIIKFLQRHIDALKK